MPDTRTDSDEALCAVLSHILRQGAAPARVCETVETWWSGWMDQVQSLRSPIALSIAGGAAADRAGWAFAAGYQSALRSLLRDQPQVLPDDAMSVFCVTEEAGNRPGDIRCQLQPTPGGWVLSGAKRWATLGPAGNLLLVAARLPPFDGARPELRMVRVDTRAAGVTVIMMPPTGFVPEVPHARLSFDAVAIGPDDLLPGDGYDRYIRPFRSVEDIHVNAAVVAYLLAEAGRRDWPAGWRERAVHALVSLAALDRLDPSAALTHLALTGALDATTRLIDETQAWWAQTPDSPASQRWARDARLFGVASGIRKLRAQRAWERIGSSLPQSRSADRN